MQAPSGTAQRDLYRRTLVNASDSEESDDDAAPSRINSDQRHAFDESSGDDTDDPNAVAPRGAPVIDKALQRPPPPVESLEDTLAANAQAAAAHRHHHHQTQRPAHQVIAHAAAAAAAARGMRGGGRADARFVRL